MNISKECVVALLVFVSMSWNELIYHIKCKKTSSFWKGTVLSESKMRLYAHFLQNGTTLWYGSVGKIYQVFPYVHENPIFGGLNYF